MSARRYPVIIEETGTGYSAYSPDVSGCAAVGDTKEETRRNFQVALAEHFEAMREIGEPIPEPNSSVDYVEIAAYPLDRFNFPEERSIAKSLADIGSLHVRVLLENCCRDFSRRLLPKQTRNL